MSALTLTSAALPANQLKLGGLTPFSATDYPGKLAVVVFVQGCPWRCAYCHNPHLQARGGTRSLDWGQVLALLQRRVGLVDALVFSGGEPTMDPALHDAIGQVRALGFGVGLHTAGIYPRRLAEVLGLVDWVGIDIKTSSQAYDSLTGISDSARHALASAQAVLDSGVAHEFRTTVHPALHTPENILRLAQTLSAMGVQNYALQVFRGTGCSDRSLPPVSGTHYPDAELVTRVAALFETFTLRREG